MHYICITFVAFRGFSYHGQVYDPLLHSEELPAHNEPEQHVKVRYQTCAVAPRRTLIFSSTCIDLFPTEYTVRTHVHVMCFSCLRYVELIKCGRIHECIAKTLSQVAVVVKNQQKEHGI